MYRARFIEFETTHRGMTRFEKQVLIGLGLLVLVLAIMEAMVPQPTDWSPSYSRFHSKPFGGKLVYDRLPDLFPEVRTISDPLYSTSNLRDPRRSGPSP